MERNARTLIHNLQDKGFNAIPILPGTKIPPTDFPLKTFFNRHMTNNEVNLWAHEDSNVAIITGKTSDNVVIVDVDDLNKVDEYKSRYPTLTARTPSGGIHLYYKSTGDELPNGTLEPHVEVFGQNHYVLTAGSYAKGERNGRAYSGSYEFINDLPIAYFPYEYYGMLSRHNKEGLKNLTPSTGKYSKSEIRGLLNFVLTNGYFPPEQHNDTLFYGSMLLASDGWEYDATLAFMMRADSNDETPQGESIVKSAVQRAYNEYAKQREEKKQEPQKVNRNSRPVKFETWDYATLIDRYATYETHWLIEDWILESSVMLMVAPPERYKTWLAVDMAISVSTGLPFLGKYPINKTGPVLFIQQEDFGPNLIKRFEVVERGKYANSNIPMEFEVTGNSVRIRWAKSADHEIYFHVDGELSLENPEAIRRLRETVEKIKPVLVIIDPLYSLGKSDDYFASLADTIRSEVKAIRNASGAAFLFVHHTSKGNSPDGSDPTQREKGFGSQLLNAASEGVINVYRPKDSNDHTVEAKRRYKDADALKPVRIEFAINKFALNDSEAYNITITDSVDDTLEAMLVEFLSTNGPTALKDLWDEFEPSGKFTSKARLGEFLKSIQGVIQDGSRRYMISPDVKV